MDWQDVAAQVTAILAPLLPYLVKVGEGTASEVGKKAVSGAWDQAKRLYEAIRDKFKGDAHAEATLTRTVEQPENETRQAALTEMLAEKAKDDPVFGQQLVQITEIAVQQEELAQFLTQVYGGRVGKIVNIGRANKVEF